MADVEHIKFSFGRYAQAEGNITQATLLLDNANDGVGGVFQARGSEDIVECRFEVTAKSGTPGTFRCSLFNITSGGLPDIAGTELAFVDISGTGHDVGWHTATFDTAYTPTRGQFLAVYFTWESGTIGAGDNITVARSQNGLGTGDLGGPASRWRSGGTWNNTSALCAITVRTDTAWVSSINCNASGQVNVDDSGDIGAYQSRLSADLGSTFTVAAAGIKGNHFGGGTLVALRLCDDGNPVTIHQDADIDSDIRAFTTSHRHAEYYFDESALTDLNNGDTLYIGLVRQPSHLGPLNSLTCDVTDDSKDYENFMGDGVAVGTFSKNMDAPEGDWIEESGNQGSQFEFVLEESTA